ncbi:MAG: leucine-rich repeat domain-containing protein [Treponema sp.]|nr:leucine-rich repeat domain-containing protein [Treponema sp.]
MKNMNKNKYKIFAVLAAVTVLFLSCNNGLQTKKSGQDGKAHISFKIDNIAREMKSASIGWNNIKKIVIKISKYDSADSQTPVSYCDDLAWTTSVNADTGNLITAYDKLQDDEIEIEYGWYKFDLELYLDTAGQNLCFSGGKSKERITDETTQLSFNVNPNPAGTGDLKLTFSIEYDPETMEDPPIVYKIQAALYSDIACTDTYLIADSEDSKDMTEIYDELRNTYNTNWNNVSIDERDPTYEPPYAAEWDYEVQNLPIGEYYLKYTLFYGIETYNMQTGEVVNTEYVKLNTITEPVKINNLGIQETIELDLEKINKLPDVKGNFVFDSSLIDITCEPLTSDFYLNNGTVIFRVKDHDSNAFINPENVSVELYYGNQELDSSYYTFDAAKYNGTYGEPDFDPYCEFKFKESKPLLTGGKYQLAIIATKPAGETTDFNTPVFYSSRTIDIDVKPKAYFEFDAGDYADAAELGDAIEDNLKGLRSDVEIKIYGTPEDLEEIYINSDSIYTARDYYSTISEKLKEMVKYNLVDLDMSQLDCAYEMGESAFNNCGCLNSIKLPASLHKIDSEAIKGATNLKTIEFTIDDNYYDIYDISLDASAFFNLTDFVQDYPVTYLSALEKIKVTNNTENETNLYTIDNGKILLCKTGASTASVKMVIPSETQIALPTDGDVSITKIEDFAFAGSEATTITGLSNVTSVGQGAFKESKIKTFDFGSALERVDSRAFKSSKLETLGTNVNGITYIGDHAFERSEITAIPDLSHLSTNLGSDAFKSCTNFQTITVDENFVDIINSNRVTYDSFASCSTKNLIINCDFILSYTNGSDSSGGYDLSYTIDGVTNTTSKTSIINMFRVTDTLTFNKKVTLPALTYNTTTPSDSGDNGFFSSSQGSYDRVGLAHLVFNDTSIIGKGQFNKFRYLSSITFNDASNLSEIGDQAFWLGNSMQLYSAEYDDSIGQQKPGTRRPQDIVLNGVRKIGYQAINKVTEEGTLTIPESVLAIQNGAFDGVMYGVAIEVEGQDSDNWLLLSGSNAETQINTWFAAPESSLPAVSTDSEANPKIEKNDITNDDITYSELTKPTSNYNGNKWYYRWTSN